MPRVGRQRRALDASRNPVTVDVVPNVPSAGGAIAALVSPDVAFAINELVDVPLQALRGGGIGDVEVSVIDEAVQSAVLCYIALHQYLLPPECVRVRRSAAEIELSRAAVQRG